MIHLDLTEHPDGVSTGNVICVVYDITRNEAYFGQVDIPGHALVWRLSRQPDPGALVSAPLELDTSIPWLLRCDRVDFPPGAIAYLHRHPGPGIRCQLFGELTVTAEGKTETYGPLQGWFESGPQPVYAKASESEPSAFVRVMLLPVEWAGKRTITYVDPADEVKPKLQEATVFLERQVELQ